MTRKLAGYTVEVKVFDSEGDVIGSISMRSSGPDDPEHVASLAVGGLFKGGVERVVGFWQALADSTATAWREQ